MPVAEATRAGLRIPALACFEMRYPRSTYGCVLSTVLVTPCLLALASQPPAQESDGGPRLTYTKVLRGSTPESLSITVNADGTGSYDGRKVEEAPNPRPIKLSAVTTDRLFELARLLNNFRLVGLESHKKVANLGLKTLTYEDGGQKYEVEFNYTLRREAQELTDLFERVAAVEEHVTSLEHAIKYDPLGLPRELLQIQADLDNHSLVDPELMVQTLEQITRNPRFLHLAQVRAQAILKWVQNNN